MKTRKPLFFFDVFGRLDELSDRIDKLEQKAAGAVAFLVLVAVAYSLRMDAMEQRTNARMDAMEQRTNAIRLEDKAEANAKSLEDKAEAKEVKAEAKEDKTEMKNLSYATLLISISALVVPAIQKMQDE